MSAHPVGEIGLVDPMPLLDLPRAGKFLVLPDAVRHDNAPFTRGSAIRAPFSMIGWSVCILPKFKSGNGAVVHLVRTVSQAHGAHVGVVLRQACILGDPGAAKGLD